MTSRKVVLSMTCLFALALLASPIPGWAQPPEGEAPSDMPPEMQAMMEAFEKASTPGEAHEHLAKAAGTWKLTIKMWMEPGSEPEINEGTAEREMIMGGRHLEERITSTAMGMPFQGRGITGYDNVTGKYWGTWIDNMSTSVLVTEGQREGDAMVFSGKASNPMGGPPTEMKMVSKMEGDDKEVVEIFEMHGGDEVKTMEIIYERQ